MDLSNHDYLAKKQQRKQHQQQPVTAEEKEELKALVTLAETVDLLSRRIDALTAEIHELQKKEELRK